MKALAQGDGFTEKQCEPASIDELLAVSASCCPHFTGAQDTVRSDLQAGGYDIAIPRSTSGCSPSWICSRDGCTISCRKGSSAAASICR